MLLRVAEAIGKAQEAVNADNDGDYMKAVLLYKVAINLIEEEIPRAPPEHKEVLIKYSKTYSKRVLALESQCQTHVSQEVNQMTVANKGAGPSEAPNQGYGFTLPVFSIEFKEHPPAPDQAPPDPPPSSVYHRAYWLMAVLANTMANGGYLTRRIYVPKAIWTQTGAKFVGMPAKIACLEGVLDHVLRLKQMDLNDMVYLFKELDAFCMDLDSIQNNLARNLAFIEEVQDVKKDVSGVAKIGERMKMFGHSLAMGASRLGSMATKVSDISNYIELLINIFQQSQFLVHDFNMLMERYVRKCRQSFTRLFPK